MNVIILLSILITTLFFKVYPNEIIVKSSLTSDLLSENIYDYLYKDGLVYVSCTDGTIKAFDYETMNMVKLFQFELNKDIGVSKFIIGNNKLITRKYIFNLTTTEIVDSLRLGTYVSQIFQFSNDELILLEIDGDDKNILKYNLPNHSYEKLFSSKEIVHMRYVRNNGFYLILESGKLQRYDEQFNYVTQIENDNLGDYQYLKDNGVYLLFSYRSNIEILDLSDLSQIYKYNGIPEYRETDFSIDGNYFVIPYYKGEEVEYYIKDLNNNDVDMFSVDIYVSPKILFKSLKEVIILSQSFNSFVYDVINKKIDKYITLFSSDNILAFQDLSNITGKREYVLLEKENEYIRVVVLDENSKIKYENYFLSQYHFKDNYYYDYYSVEQTDTDILFPVINDSKIQIARLNKENYSIDYFGSYDNLVIDIDYDKDSNTLALGGYERILYLYDCTDYTEIVSEEVVGQIVKVKNINGKIYFGEGVNACNLAEYDIGKDEYTSYEKIFGYSNWAYCENFNFSDNGEWLVLFNDGVELYNIESLEKEYQYEFEDFKSIEYLSVSSKGEILLSTKKSLPLLLNSSHTLPSSIENYIKKYNKETNAIKSFFNSDNKRVLFVSKDPVIMDIEIDSTTSSVFNNNYILPNTRRIIGNVINNLEFLKITDIKLYNTRGEDLSSVLNYFYKKNTLILSNLQRGLFILVLNQNTVFVILNK